MADDAFPERKNLNLVADEQKKVDAPEAKKPQVTQQLQQQSTVNTAKRAARAAGGLELLNQVAEGTGQALEESLEDDLTSQVERQQLQLIQQQLENQLITQAQYEEYLRQLQMREMIRQRQLQQQQAVSQLGQELEGVAGSVTSAAGAAAASGGGLSALTMGFACNPIFAPLYFTGKLFKKLIKK